VETWQLLDSPAAESAPKNEAVHWPALVTGLLSQEDPLPNRITCVPETVKLSPSRAIATQLDDAPATGAGFGSGTVTMGAAPFESLEAASSAPEPQADVMSANAAYTAYRVP
jgi:hypothetical protein